MTLENVLQMIINKQNRTNELFTSEAQSKDILFRDYLISYLRSIDGETRSRSFSATLTAAAHIIDGLGDYYMSEIDKETLRKFLNSFAKKQYLKNPTTKQHEYYSQSEINKVYNLLHRVIKEASSDDGNRLLRTDYMASIKKPRTRQSKKPEPKPFTREEINNLLDVVREDKMIYLWVLLMLYTGARPSEILALKWSDINYKEKTISISRTLSQEDFYDAKHLKKIRPSVPIITDLKNERNDGSVNWQKRKLKVSNIVLLELYSWELFVKGNTALMKKKRENNTEDYLFCGPKGQFWLYEYYSQRYERLLKRHGLKYANYNPYRFRHNYCTYLFRKNRLCQEKFAIWGLHEMN
jgi:integrase